MQGHTAVLGPASLQLSTCPVTKRAALSYSLARNSSGFEEQLLRAAQLPPSPQSPLGQGPFEGRTSAPLIDYNMARASIAVADASDTHRAKQRQ